jgi:retinol dehydrogenase-14
VKLAVVTGASSGIGRAAAVELARRGFRVVAVGRDPRRLERVAKEMEKTSGERPPDPLRADFASLAEVRRLAAELLGRHERLDVLVNNAGVVMGRRELTPDGYETTFAVNHLAPFLLTNLLLDRLKDSAPARIVTTSSGAHYSGRIDFSDLHGERSYSAWQAYCGSKLANVLFTMGLAKRLEGTRVTANCAHPGVIRSRLGRKGPLPARLAWSALNPFFGSPKAGARVLVHLASAPEAAEVSGEYYVGTKRRPPKADEHTAERLWAISSELTGLRST